LKPRQKCLRFKCCKCLMKHRHLQLQFKQHWKHGPFCHVNLKSLIVQILCVPCLQADVGHAIWLLLCLNTRLDKQILFHNIGSIFMSWYNKELSSLYTVKLRYQLDVYLISIWCLYLFDFILMSWSWKIKVKKSSNRWLYCIYLKSFVWSGKLTQNKWKHNFPFLQDELFSNLSSIRWADTLLGMFCISTLLFMKVWTFQCFWGGQFTYFFIIKNFII
jgi:hypothetical protein